MINRTSVDQPLARNISRIIELLRKRIRYVGYISTTGKQRRIPIDLDPFMNSILSGAMPNISNRFNNISSDEEGARVIVEYLLNGDISSSHIPTLLKSKEAPNYHFKDYPFISEENKVDILRWLFSFYYLYMWSPQTKRKSIIGIRSDNETMREILEENFRRVGSDFYFELKTGRIQAEVGNNMYVYFLPTSPSSTYFALLILLSAIFQLMDVSEEYQKDMENLTVEVLLLKNSGGNKWNVVYHPTVNLSRLYRLFFATDDAYTSSGNVKFIEFLRSLLPPRLNNQNAVESYYSNLASLSFSLLIEGYLNVEKLSEIISEKISLEFRAQRENKAHKLGIILFMDYVQQKIIGGEKMDEKFQNLRKSMQAIGYKIGQLSSKGETQKSLLKRIIMDLKSEDMPTGFAAALINYLPRLEREEIRITIPPELATLPIREFLVIKNEFVSILWNKYIGGGSE